MFSNPLGFTLTLQKIRWSTQTLVRAKSHATSLNGEAVYSLFLC
jgi:hypothetical protein